MLLEHLQMSYLGVGEARALVRTAAQTRVLYSQFILSAANNPHLGPLFSCTPARSICPDCTAPSPQSAMYGDIAAQRAALFFECDGDCHTFHLPRAIHRRARSPFRGPPPCVSAVKVLAAAMLDLCADEFIRIITTSTLARPRACAMVSIATCHFVCYYKSSWKFGLLRDGSPIQEIPRLYRCTD